MYGMIHRAIRGMVLDEVGHQAWHAIEVKAGTGSAELISVIVYDDAVTLDLLAAAADQLVMPLPELLEKFGRFWIRFIQQRSYGAIMDYAGRDLVSFLRNIDRLHVAVLATMPLAVMPSFTVKETGPGIVHLHYSSRRKGLEPFVKGLLQGLLDKFGLEGTVETVQGGDNEMDILIRYNERELAR